MERDIGPVEQDRRRRVRRLDVLPRVRHVHYGERGDGPGVRQVHLGVGSDPVGRAGPPRGDVHQPALRAPLPDQAALGQTAQVSAFGQRGGVLVAQPHRGDRHRDGAGHHDCLGRVRRLRGLGGHGCLAGPARARVLGGVRGVRLEARDVADAADPLVRPPRPDPHSRPHHPGVPRRAKVHGMQHRGVGAIQPDQRPRERPVQRLAVERLRHPGPGDHRPGRANLDQGLPGDGGHRVELEGRRVHPAVGGARPEDALIPQRGHERAEHWPERPCVVERDLHRCPHDRGRWGVSHRAIVERVLLIEHARQANRGLPHN